MQPHFHNHEAEVDVLLASLKSRAFVFLQAQARRAWTHVVSSAAAPRPADLMSEDPVAHDAAAGMGAQPSLADPLSGPAQLLGSLWGSYGPGLLISGAALLQQSAAPGAPLGMNATARAASALMQPPAPVPTTRLDPGGRPQMQHAGSSTQSALERRRQLEAELAALDSRGETPGQTPTPAPSGFRQRTRGGGLEEAEVPSDIE
jgi:receptor expression-enhancing protein 1/2/3/4